MRAVRELRHRGDDERPPPRARVHGARRRSSSSRLLPRPRRPPAREGRLRRRDARPARLARRAAGAVADTLTAPLQRSRRGRARSSPRTRAEIAAVIVEPVAGNMGLRPAGRGFLEGLRELDRRDGRAARVRRGDDGLPRAPGGAQALYGVTPDLTTLGKMIGGGLPVGAYGGRARRHGAGRAGRARLPGRHAVRESARDDGGDRDAAHSRPAGSRDGSRMPRSGSLTASATQPPRPVCPGSRCTPATMFGFFFTDSAGRELGGREAGRHGALRCVPRQCSSAASICPRRSSRPGSCRPRTATPRSTRRSKPRARRSPCSADRAAVADLPSRG